MPAAKLAKRTLAGKDQSRMEPPMSEDARGALVTAESLISAAVGILYGHCGEQVTIATLQHMAEEQAKLLTRYKTIIMAKPLTAAVN